MAVAAAATGRVIAITGPVVDIEFPAGQLPAIFNAVEIQREGDPLIVEVQQHLGNNWVRAVAMTTDQRSGGSGHARARVQRARPADR